MAGLPILQDTPVPRDHQEPTRPPWIRVRAPSGERYRALRALLEERRLHTVCSSAACPNIGECWGNGTATFMILGNHCTRACRFCDVLTTARPPPVDLDEPERLAEAAELMGLEHVVITSVARDDLEDGGAAQFVRCLEAVNARLPEATLEVLTPDFMGREQSVLDVVSAPLQVFNHNLETVRRRTARIRSGADYDRSLEVLALAKRLNPKVKTKSGLMLGLGETDEELKQAIEDLRAHGVDLLTLGQYLRPSKDHHPVMRYPSPETFEELGQFARDLGFSHVESGPLVRSSYHAERGARG
jgi:lipoic acid synthetase